MWIDFDGTITRADVLDELIRFCSVDDSWKQLEQQWQSGRIGSYECLTREFALLRIGHHELQRFIDTIPVDPGAAELFALLAREGVPCAILSDGVDRFIHRILRRIGCDGMEIRSNTINHEQDRLHLICPHRSADCEASAAHCKCSSAGTLAQPGRRTIYIGDGLSDVCPARRADVVFAKGALAARLQVEQRAFIPFAGLRDVSRMLAENWSSLSSLTKDRACT